MRCSFFFRKPKYKKNAFNIFCLGTVPNSAKQCQTVPNSAKQCHVPLRVGVEIHGDNQGKRDPCNCACALSSAYLHHLLLAAISCGRSSASLCSIGKSCQTLSYQTLYLSNPLLCNVWLFFVCLLLQQLQTRIVS